MKAVPVASLMRRALLYLAALAVAAIAVFLATYLLGRHPSLEAELERLTSPRDRRPIPADPGASRRFSPPRRRPKRRSRRRIRAANPSGRGSW